jgi:glycosyltransferase involved in cell wall biosynthesis
VKPSVSVVMPVLDGARWLAEAIASILDQTHRALELIVVDDGSKDGSPEIPAAAAARDGRVTVLKLERDPASRTSGRAANAGIAAARGDFVARMDADDVALPQRLERQLAFLAERKLDACGGLAVTMGAAARELWFPESHDAVERELVFRVGMLHPTMLAKAELMRRLPYRETVAHEDYEWQVRAAAAGARLGNMQEVVLRHRSHPGQANRRHRAHFRRDLRRFRFAHAMRLFPGTSAEQFQSLAFLAERVGLRDNGELEAAAAWLVRLSSGGEPKLRGYMLKRWERACAGAVGTVDAGLRDRVAQAIEAG